MSWDCESATKEKKKKEKRRRKKKKKKRKKSSQSVLETQSRLLRVMGTQV